ncbi:MAG: hypothetical protein RLZZ618_2732 [Pseudomonadota bacterium]|jgi:hypothetical protein
MSESHLISQRFLARVERSLLKRLNGDIHPHLVRFAAHAHSKEEFMASAARLLVNPREREQWLASWVTRLRAVPPDADSATAPLDTSPAPLDLDLDTTMPVMIDTPAARAPRISDAQLVRVHVALSVELGSPAALRVMEAELPYCESTTALLARLQTHLQSDSQRLRFVNSALSSINSDA